MRKIIRNYKELCLAQLLRSPKALRYFLPNSLDAWFYNWLVLQRQEWRNKCFPTSTYYEFGVGEGGSIVAFTRAAVAFCKRFNTDLKKIKVFGFDSFEGLPDPVQFEDQHPEWERGTYACGRDLVLERIAATGFPLSNVTLIQGFFDKTLTPTLADELKSDLPSIVTVDVDYYSSTKLVLNFLEPLLRDGVVFYFDDIWSFNGHPHMGELKAIDEFHGSKGFLVPCSLMGDLGGRSYIFTPLQSEIGDWNS